MSDTTASERLTHALDALDHQEKRTPCMHPRTGHRWTSDDPDEREAAAHECRMCPVLRECGAAADERKERWHVFAGVDRTAKSKR